MRPVLDLVVVTYQAPRETERFFASLGHVDVPFCLQVVDNASPEDEVREVIRCALPQVQALPLCVTAGAVFNRENEGYAKACNSGAYVPYGWPAPYLALLNADTEFLPGVASAIVDYFEANVDVGVVGPRTTDLRGRLTHAGIFQSRRLGEQHRYFLSRDRGQANDVLDVPTVSGATYFVRRETWDKLTVCPLYQNASPGAQGAFLATPHYFEERYASAHSWEHGWRVVYLGNVRMIHVWHASSPVGSPLSEGRWKESRQLFERACKAHDIAVPA